MGEDESELAARAAAGDGAALEALLTRIRPDVLRLCGRFLPHREDAEEACQDTLLAVARGIGGYERRAAFRTWLYRVAVNRARTTYQVLRRRAEREAAGVPLPEPADPRRTSVVAGTRLDLLDGLQAIGPELAELVALRDLAGLSYAELSRTLGLPEGTVKSRLHEARRRLRDRMSERDLDHSGGGEQTPPAPGRIA